MKQNLHQQSPPQITLAETWNNPDLTVIDVRSESEFRDGAIPDAINIPLLTDAERAIIGCLYKYEGQQRAIDNGYEVFEPKVRDYLDQFNQLSARHPLAIYCARGGMRSQVITAFLSLNGIEAFQVTGGYKAFRNWTLEQLDRMSIQFPVVLHGKTGVGKTLVLEKLENSIDLEGLAHHRGSMFGGIGKKPAGQKNFEAVLLRRFQVLDNARPVFIEGESRRIGRVMIPNRLFSQMKTAKMLFLDAAIETRVKRTVEEYIDRQPDNIPIIRDTIKELVPDLGKKAVQMLLEQFDKQDYASCFEYILLNYYDKKYTYGFKKMNFEKVISTEDIDQAASDIVQFCSNQLKW